MFRRNTIGRRILLTFTLVVIGGSLLQLLISGTQLQAAILEFHLHDLETEALIASSQLGFRTGERDEDDEGRLPQGTSWIPANLRYDYYIVDPSLTVVATSEDDIATGTRIAETEEIRQAQRQAIGRAIRDGNFYVAAPIPSGERGLSFLVLYDTTADAYADVEARWLQLILSTVPILGLVVIASLWISRTIARPIRALDNTALQMADGAFDARIEIGSDDEIGRLGHSFNYMAEQLAALLRSQREFISNAAHELRTPLMTFKLRIEALATADLPPEERQTYLRELNEQVDHMASLVSSLLILARIDEGRHQVSIEAYDSTALLHDVARHWRIEAQRANLGFETDIPVDLPDIRVASNDLRMILDNLFSNAIKYTRVGKVTFSAGHSKDVILLKVTDTGSGFASGEGDQIFTRFFRAADARAAEIPGTGLGLAILQSIVALYHGRVEAHSDGPGQGAQFIVTLPLKPPSSAA
ncbi:MAG: HAMP domain-containing histidine kinase [Anaerolineae bacterium]|nr:HAMP domain-containing histidine kinase [Anaerolineae bacterium]